MPKSAPFTKLCQSLARLTSKPKADLHVHSTHSDGVAPVADMVTFARRANLFALAFADHDTTAGYEEAVRVADTLVRPPLRPGATRPVLRLVPGVEITAEFRGREMHLLAYFFDVTDAPLQAALARLRDARRGRLAEMARRADAAGYPVDREQVERLVASGASLGRPHMGRLLKDAGHNARELMRSGGPVYIPSERLNVAEAVRLVGDAGGLTSWAHPPDDCTDGEADELREMGLAALEAEYPFHEPTRRGQLRRMAGRCGLKVTGGSDCHDPQSPRTVGSQGLSRALFNDLERRET